MNLLDLDQLFYTCPYPVKYDGDEYTFRTDHDIVYAVDFKEELSFAPIPAYWFDLTNRSHRPSPSIRRCAKRSSALLSSSSARIQTSCSICATMPTTSRRSAIDYSCAGSREPNRANFSTSRQLSSMMREWRILLQS